MVNAQHTTLFQLVQHHWWKNEQRWHLSITMKGRKNWAKMQYLLSLCVCVFACVKVFGIPTMYNVRPSLGGTLLEIPSSKWSTRCLYQRCLNVFKFRLIITIFTSISNSALLASIQFKAGNVRTNSSFKINSRAPLKDISLSTTLWRTVAITKFILCFLNTRKL